MQEEFTMEQLERIDEVISAFEHAINVTLDMPQDIKKKYNVEAEEGSYRYYAMMLADEIADELTCEFGKRVYFPWHNDDGIHDLYNEEG